MKVTPTKIITTSSENINSVPNKKYRLSPNEIEKKSLSSERFRTLFNFHRVSEQKNYTTDMIGTIRKNTELKEKENFKLDLRIFNKESFDVTIPFKNRTDVLINSFQYYNTTTKKQETMEFYDYCDHLERFGFTWKNDQLEFEYSVKLSPVKKN